jgi:hypothetical protein
LVCLLEFNAQKKAVSYHTAFLKSYAKNKAYLSSSLGSANTHFTKKNPAAIITSNPMIPDGSFSIAVKSKIAPMGASYLLV